MCWGGNNISLFALVMGATLAGVTPTQAAIFQSSASLRGQQYATEEVPGSRMDLNLGLTWQSPQTPDSTEKPPSLASRELHFFSFYETGPGGDYSLDVDRTVQRIFINDRGHLWLGRTHPLTEATGGSSPTYVDAIGTNWSQNQSDALDPRVAGWIGLGGHIEDGNRAFSITAAYSPVFLPSFGPRVQLSESSPARGSRFSRLPPQYVQQGDATLPLRYKLNVDDIKSIIFQPQAFVSLGYASSVMRVDVMDWTAPNPSPDIDTDAALVPHTQGDAADDSVDVIVDAHPKFRRQHFTGLRYEGSSIPGKPLFSSTYEWFRKEITASLQTTPIEFITFGILNRWAPDNENSSSSAAISPSYSDGLVWTELRARFYHDRIFPSLRIEEHIASGNRGRLIRPKIVYSAASGFNVFAVAQVMRGQDRSYFGEWRSLGSAAMGVNWAW